MSNNTGICHGDIFIQQTGGGNYDGKSYVVFGLFEFRENNESGKGFRYSRGGEDYCFFWAHPKEENKFKNISEDVLFSFKHGSDRFEVDSYLIKGGETPEELIKLSNFRFVSKKQVDAAQIIEGIKTLDDVIANWDHIKAHGANYLIATLCLESIGATIPPVKNGEIGIHSMQVVWWFYKYIEHIEDELIRIQNEQ
jgi:hypothetical protein